MSDSGTEGSVAPTEVDRLTTLPKPGTPVDVRDRLLDMLRRDLVGPHPDYDPDLAREVLAGSSPSTWYLTGYLGPKQASRVEARARSTVGEETGELFGEEDAEERLDQQRLTEDMSVNSPATGRDDEGESERPPSRSFEPSSMGLSVLISPRCETLSVRLSWGDYVTEPRLDDAVFIPEKNEEARRNGGAPSSVKKTELNWRRIPADRQMDIPIAVLREGGKHEQLVPDSAAPMRPGGGGLMLVATARPTRSAPIDGESRDLLAVSVFLVNRRSENLRRFGDIAFCFQARLALTCEDGFEPRDDRASYGTDDFDQRLSDLHYSDVFTYASGHNTSGDWEAPGDDGRVRTVFTNPIPQQAVEKLSPDLDCGNVVRDMAALGQAAEGIEALRAALIGLPDAYAAWIAAQAAEVPAIAGERRRDIAGKLIDNAEKARQRIAGGIAKLLSDPMSREAFAIMNRTMERANRQRAMVNDPQRRPAAEQRPPSWRLFQLAFILLNLEGLADPRHEDRPIVDLLFFPTGGGKTEAYLGLAAFAIARRRLDNPGKLGAGLSVVMRYTLRLLTLDQLQRAAGLVCALELERTNKKRLGDWPIEIGLWVGSGATPNSLGDAKNKKQGTAVFAVEQYRKGGQSPAPIKECPWCGAAFGKNSFRIYPNATRPERLDLRCENVACDFSDGERLPISVVDQEVYRRLPAFMIATVDKFANVSYVGEAGAFFGHVGHSDYAGFYGAAGSARGTTPLDNELPPIDLIIQDELHLISGPLGTIAGLYETAFDLLASRIINGERRGPKIVASTATVRRAEAQIRSLFGREDTAIFPPPGITRRDSFFAREDIENPSRLYVGVASPGRGPKLVFLRTLQTLLAGSQVLATGTDGDPADPYLTALCYFNALRELGGARRIVDDEVRSHLRSYGRDRVRGAPTGAPFADRTLRDIQELTSRFSTDDVSKARQCLGLAAKEKSAVDVALATNMISVGLDIGRLGLMVVQGQPKTAAEYIQATSRVGRVGSKPGLVVALLNMHKPRDRTHYEQFRAFHSSFYRAVEATSVTPFAPRALDRALAATLVAAVRHLDASLSPNSGAENVEQAEQAFESFIDAVERKLSTSRESQQTVESCRRRIDALRSAWGEIAAVQTANGGEFVYSNSAPPQRLLQDPLAAPNPDDPRRSWFKAARSMRDTEPVARLKLRSPRGHSFQQ